jgi:BON domain
MFFLRLRMPETSPRAFGRTARRVVCKLLICIAVPSLFVVSGSVLAQNAPGAQSSDQQIADALSSKLAAAFGNPIPFSVGINHGAVTMTGTVSSAAQREQAESLVRSVAGVTTVDDQLTIGAPAAPPDDDGNLAPADQTAPDQTAPAQTPPSQTAPGPPPNPPQQPSGAPVPPNAQGYAPPPSRNGYGQPMVTIPTGTPMYVLMLQSFGSKHTKPGEQFHGVLAQNVVLPNGAIALPRGTRLDGTVVDARPAGHLKGRPILALQLNNVDMADNSYALNSSIWQHEGPGKGGQTAATVTGTSVIGAFAGGVAGGGSGALLGGLFGGLGGAGLSALSSGPRLFIPAESVLTFYVNAPLTVREPTPGEIQAAAQNVPYGYDRRRGPRPYYPPSPYGGYPPPPPPVPGAPPGGYPY